MTSKVIWTCDACGAESEYDNGSTSDQPAGWQLGFVARKSASGKYDDGEWEDLCPVCADPD